MDQESKYSTNDLCQMFGVGRETLRHYENLGLLNPKINPENGYRNTVIGILVPWWIS